jgi:uncharacterized protein YbjT (DUF2867 family)
MDFTIESNMLLITGASGRVAGRVAALLAQRGHALRLMSRTPQRAPRLDGAEVVRGDFAEPATLNSAFVGVSAALVVSGSGKPGERAQLHRNAFEAAAHARVQHMVYLSLQGASPTSRYPYSRDHSLSEQYLAATGLPRTVLRNAFYWDMFLERFDAGGVMRGPAGQTRGAFVSREDAAQTAAAVLVDPPGGVHDVTGAEAVNLAEVARRLSAITGRQLRYQSESVESAREWLSKREPASWRVDLSVGWFEAIAVGELEHISDTVFRFTGKEPLTPEEYFKAFPELLQPLRLSGDQNSNRSIISPVKPNN